MKVPLLDLKGQFQSIEDEILPAIREVALSQQFILGPKVEALEKAVAAYCGAGFAVGVSSGTDALLISLMTAGVGHGDLVLTSPYTFFATAGAIARVGARPLFVDIDADTYNIDPAKLEERVSALDSSERTRLRAIIPVHLFGQCADMEPILKTAASIGAVVIEDAAQAIGSEYRFENGTVKRAGSMGQYGCFSFYPTKNLGGAGEGGMVTTQDSDLYDRLRIIRNHGDVGRYEHAFIGGNFRLDALQAAVLGVKLKYLDSWTERRIENANLYRRLFQETGVEGVTLPKEREQRHIYNQFVIKVAERRDELKKYLNENEVGCEVYYPVPLHMQACFKSLGHAPEDFPVSADAAARTLALPIYPELSGDQIQYVVEKIKEFIG